MEVLAKSSLLEQKVISRNLKLNSLAPYTQHDSSVRSRAAGWLRPRAWLTQEERNDVNGPGVVGPNELTEVMGVSVEEQNGKAAEQVEAEEVVENASLEADQVEGEAVEAEATAEQASGEASAEADHWKAEAAKLAEQIDAFKDQAVRAQAEMQNIRRRAEMDVEKAHKFALEKFAKELLPVIDSLEKAIESDQEQNEQAGVLREGVEMTLSMFLGGIKKFNLEPVDPLGHPFDPALHEAMSMVPSPDAEPNSVIAVMQKGYTLSGRLIRPAMVMVAKQP